MAQEEKLVEDDGMRGVGRMRRRVMVCVEWEEWEEK